MVLFLSVDIPDLMSRLSGLVVRGPFHRVLLSAPVSVVAQVSASALGVADHQLSVAPVVRSSVGRQLDGFHAGLL